MPLRMYEMVQKILNNQILFAITAVVIGFFCYSLADALLKNFISKYHISQIFFTNSLVIFVLAFVHGFRKHKAGLFKTNHYVLYFMYASLAMLGFGTNMVAMSNIRLDQFYTIVFTAPLWITLLSRIVFKEKVDTKPLIAICLGFLVILAVMRPGGDMFNIGAFAALGSAIIFSINTMLVKKSKGEIHSRALLLIFSSLMGIIVSQVYLYDNFVMPDLKDSFLFIICGAMAFMGGMFVLSGFQRSPASYIVAPFHYTQMIWGAALGYLIFNDIPSMDVIIGASALISIGLYLIYYQVQQSKKVLAFAPAPVMAVAKFRRKKAK